MKVLVSLYLLMIKKLLIFLFLKKNVSLNKSKNYGLDNGNPKSGNLIRSRF